MRETPFLKIAQHRKGHRYAEVRFHGGTDNLTGEIGQEYIMLTPDELRQNALAFIELAKEIEDTQ